MKFPPRRVLSHGLRKVGGTSVAMLALSLARPLSDTLTELDDGDRCTVEPCIVHMGYDVSMMLPCPSELRLLWTLQNGFDTDDTGLGKQMPWPVHPCIWTVVVRAEEFSRGKCWIVWLI